MLGFKVTIDVECPKCGAEVKNVLNQTYSRYHEEYGDVMLCECNGCNAKLLALYEHYKASTACFEKTKEDDEKMHAMMW